MIARGGIGDGVACFSIRISGVSAKGVRQRSVKRSTTCRSNFNSAGIGLAVQFITQRPVLHVGVVIVQCDRPRDSAIIIFNARLFYGVKAELYRGVAINYFLLGVFRFNMDLIGRGNVAALQIRRKHAPIGQLVILTLVKSRQCAGKALVIGFIRESLDTGRSATVLYDCDVLRPIQLDISHDIFQLNRMPGSTVGAPYFYGILYGTLFKVIVSGRLLGVNVAFFIVILLNGDLAGAFIVELNSGFLVGRYLHVGGLTIENHITVNRRTIGIHRYIRIVERNGNHTVFNFTDANGFVVGIIDSTVFFEIFQSIRQVVLNGV